MTEQDAFGEFVAEHSRSLLRAAWLLTGDWTSLQIDSVSATSPVTDGRYVAIGAGDRVRIFDGSTGEQTFETTIPGVTVQAVWGLTPATDGRWVLTASGMGQHVRFQHNGEIPREIVSGGGGFPVTMTRIGGVMWVGSSTRLVCADADTGQVRASAELTHAGNVTADVESIAQAGGRTFAVLEGHAGRQIVTLHPPTQCTG